MANNMVTADNTIRVCASGPDPTSLDQEPKSMNLVYP